MSLRDQVARVFARPKARTPREAMKDAARTPAQVRADAEKTLQLRELADKRPERMNEARAAIAREHPAPHLRPDWANRPKTAAMIEAAARKEVDRQQGNELAGIEAKTEARLLTDADERQAKEAQAAADRSAAPVQTDAASSDPDPFSPVVSGDAWFQRDSPSLSPEERAARMHVAPLGWEHIALTGDYVWSGGGPETGFRPLRDVRAAFLPQAA